MSEAEKNQELHQLHQLHRLAALAAVRRRVHQITYEELEDVVNVWVDAALRLTTRDLKLMQRLAYFRPSLPPPSGDSNFAAQHAMFVAGYEAAVRELFDMRKASESEVKSPPEAYPDLDDNTKWQDQTNP